MQNKEQNNQQSNNKRDSDYRVYVLDKDAVPMMPTKVWHMLNDGTAKVVCNKPFTIQLQYEPETHVVQKVVLGTDPGRTNIGLCAVREAGMVLFAGELETQNKEIPDLMRKRKMHRQASRQGERHARKRLAKKHHTTTNRWNPRVLPGCEKPVLVMDIRNTEARLCHRKRHEGWLTPTAMQLRRTHGAIAIISKFLLIVWVSMEESRFAFMQLDDPRHVAWHTRRGHCMGSKTFAMQSSRSKATGAFCVACRSATCAA